MFYQPQVMLGTGELAGFEALVRWQHPQRGLLAPLEFIGIGEESGLMVPVENWILKQACRDAASWMRHRAHFTLSVNLSASQLANPILPESVSRILEESGLPPSALCLEITENALVRSTNSTECLAALRALGVRLSLDDFGTGYASLTYLANIRPDELKIDESLVHQLAQRDGAHAMVAAVIALAHNLGAVASAKGVETDEQRQVVESLGCDRAQGLLFGPPFESHEIGRTLEDGRAWTLRRSPKWPNR